MAMAGNLTGPKWPRMSKRTVQERENLGIRVGYYPHAGSPVIRAVKYGNESWELDALDPTTLKSLIEEEVKEHRDLDLYRDTLAQEKK